jgi:nucleotide-binding universal stress UspA family protein
MDGPDSSSQGASNLEIAVGFDGHSGGRDALALGRTLVSAGDATLTAVVVVPFPPSTLGEQIGMVERPATWPDLCEELREHGRRRLLDSAAVVLGDTDFGERIVLDDSPARALTAYASEEKPDVLVVGSTHRGKLGRVFAGSIPTKLLSGGECAVAVAPREFRERSEQPVRRIVVGYDGRPEADRALSEALKLAERHEAAVRVLAIVEPSSSLEYELKGEVLREAFQALSGQGLHDRRGGELHAGAERTVGEAATTAAIPHEIEVVHGDPAELLIAASAGECDLLVLGSRGYGPLGRALLGSTSTKVLRGSEAPVIIYPRPS